MFALLLAFIAAAGSAIRSRANLAIEDLALRQQLAVLRRFRSRGFAHVGRQKMSHNRDVGWGTGWSMLGISPARERRTVD